MIHWFGDLARLTRLSNLPTVWTNVLVGLAAGYAAVSQDAATGASLGFTDIPMRTSPWLTLAGGLLIVSASCLYLGGMILNDVVDFAYDTQYKPDRPLPAGRLSRSIGFILAVALFALGIMPLFFLEAIPPLIAGLALLATIVSYNLLHKHTSAAVFLMGECRAWVVIMAASAYHVPIQTWLTTAAPFAVALGLYVVGITLVARLEDENRQDRRRFAALAMIGVVMAVSLFIQPPLTVASLVATLIAAAIVFAWLIAAATKVLGQPPRTGAAVSMWLSGLCLVDLWFLMLLNQPLLGSLAGGCFILTVLAQRKIAGT